MRLTRRQLNRATLARQLLLKRERIDAVIAVERIGGLQAQEPASPYLALWARIDGLEAGAVSEALLDRRLVKATLHRSTLHVLGTTDYLGSVAAITTVLRTKWMNESRGLPVERSLPELAEEALRFAAEPRTNVEMRDFCGSFDEPVPGDELWRRIRRYAHFIQVPGAHSWAFGRRPIHVAARSWIEATPEPEDRSLAHVIRAYLGAFGPALLADVSQWSGLAVGRLRPALDSIADLVRHADEDGRELLDLEGAELPAEDTPAPPRLLPMWDETLLAYKDRSRVLPEAYRKRVIVKAGDVLPTFTVDGLVAGLWWSERDEDGRPRVVFEPFEPLEASNREALEAEGARLADFIAEREPAVYSRYRHTARRS